jgi:hypothetical protein
MVRDSSFGFLSWYGFVGADDVADAMTWLAGRRDPRRRRPPRRLRVVLRIIENFEGAGG